VSVTHALCLRDRSPVLGFRTNLHPGTSEYNRTVACAIGERHYYPLIDLQVCVCVCVMPAGVRDVTLCPVVCDGVALRRVHGHARVCQVDRGRQISRERTRLSSHDEMRRRW
jgi:hypothetical protein